MKNTSKYRAWLGCLLLLNASAAMGAPVAAKPNILLILADDLGWSDIGCYGSEISTPNLDALAADGLRFTQFYNTGRCCPTRASLLTGLYPHQAGMGGMTLDLGVDGYRGDLNKECVTIAEVLRAAGYATYAAGKWHVTKFKVPSKTAEEDKFNWPLQRGFDRYFGIINGAANYFHPESLALDNTPQPTPGDGFYTTDAFVDKAIEFINDCPKDKPFFLYLAFNAPHWPLQAPPADVAKYQGKYAEGWDKLREERHARQIQLGLLDSDWALSPRTDDIPAWDSLSLEDKARSEEIMTLYAAVVDHMDQAVGRLIDDLKKRGELDNTLIFFMSDNGGCAEGGVLGKLEKSTPSDSAYCGEAWANLENTPFRLYKHYNHEGGTSAPFIVHWPAGIPLKGELRTQPSHLIDIMATSVDVSGAKYPAEFNGHPITPMEGKSLLPEFAGQPVERGPIFWEHMGNAAVRDGDWKLVRLGRNGAWELYNMKTDRTELHDLAATNPEKAKDLAAKWDAWAERARVKPYPSEKKGKGKKKGKKKGEESGDE